VHYDIGEVVVRIEFYERSKLVKCVWGEVRCRLDCILQLVEIGMEDSIRLPSLVHVTGVPQHAKLLI
jgi:hypothetical protein